jgi:hypothetical protein
MESARVTSVTSSYTWVSSTEGTKLAPMPWILCGPGAPPLRIGESLGSTPMIRMDGLRSFNSWPAPVMVPPVPMPATSRSTAPSVSSQISTPVVALWMAGLAGLSNWRAQMAPGVAAAISFAFSTAPRMPSEPGVSTSSAP